MKLKSLFLILLLVLGFSLHADDEKRIWGDTVILYNYDHPAYLRSKPKIKDRTIITMYKEDKNGKIQSDPIQFNKDEFYSSIHYRKSSAGEEFSLILDVSGTTSGSNARWTPTTLSGAKDHIVLTIRQNDIANTLHVECLLKEINEGNSNQFILKDKCYNPVQTKHFLASKQGGGYSIYSYSLNINTLPDLSQVGVFSCAQCKMTLSSSEKKKLDMFLELYNFLTKE